MKIGAVQKAIRRGVGASFKTTPQHIVGGEIARLERVDLFLHPKRGLELAWTFKAAFDKCIALKTRGAASRRLFRKLAGRKATRKVIGVQALVGQAFRLKGKGGRAIVKRLKPAPVQTGAQ